MSGARVRIGFVPLYRAPSYRKRVGTREWCLRMREDSLAALARVEGMQLVVPKPSAEGSGVIDPVDGRIPDGLVCNLDTAEAIAEYLAREKVDGIILGAMDFGDERAAARIAERLRVPILLYATKEPPALEDASMARVSDSYCGTLAIAAVLRRRKVTFQFAGVVYPQEPEFLSEVEAFVRAVAVVKAFRGGRIGQIGMRPETFESVSYDEAAMVRKFGQYVIPRELASILLQAAQYADDDPRILGIVDEYKGSLAEIRVARDWLLKAARLELALAEFWAGAHLSAMAIQCWPTVQTSWSMSICAVLGRLTQRGLLAACEADVLGALSMLASYHASLGQAVPHFIDWTIQHRSKPDCVLAWHCGNAPVCLASDPNQVSLRSRYDMKGVLPVNEGDSSAGMCRFQLRPGRVTLCRLAEEEGQWKMLVALGQAVASDDVLPGTWCWVELDDHAALYSTLIENGFIHHASLVHGDQRKVLVQACKFLGIEPIVVG